MVISYFKKLFFVPAVLAILVLASCQKEIDINDPDIIPEEVMDSTLLVKSIMDKIQLLNTIPMIR
jgi:hypothetical protein